MDSYKKAMRSFLTGGCENRQLDQMYYSRDISQMSLRFTH